MKTALVLKHRRIGDVWLVSLSGVLTPRSADCAARRICDLMVGGETRALVVDLRGATPGALGFVQRRRFVIGTAVAHVVLPMWMPQAEAFAWQAAAAGLVRCPFTSLRDAVVWARRPRETFASAAPELTREEWAALA